MICGVNVCINSGFIVRNESVLLRVVTMSVAVSFVGISSILTADFFPELALDPSYPYSCGLLDFATYNSVPNINESNNKFYFRSVNKLTGLDDFILIAEEGNDSFDYYLEIPVGAYEFRHIFEYIGAKIGLTDISLELKVNPNTLKCVIKCSATLLFDRENSIHQLLGFKSQTIAPDNEAISDYVVSISSLNTINIECDIVHGSYINGKSSHCLYEFAPKIETGYKIVEVPRNIVYLPVNRHNIQSIQLRIVDQDGHLIDFRGEKVSCRIHIKKD